MKGTPGKIVYFSHNFEHSSTFHDYIYFALQKQNLKKILLLLWWDQISYIGEIGSRKLIRVDSSCSCFWNRVLLNDI